MVQVHPGPPFQKRMPFHVYILRSQSTGRFYIGHTENLIKRIFEHNSNRTPPHE